MAWAGNLWNIPDVCCNSLMAYMTCHGWPVSGCCCDLLQTRQSLTKQPLVKESKYERGTGADPTKLMQIQFAVVGFWFWHHTPHPLPVNFS